MKHNKLLSSLKGLISSQTTPEKIFEAETTIATKGVRAYVGNTIKMPFTIEDEKQVLKINYLSNDNTIALVTNGVVTALKEGETVVVAQVTLIDENQIEHYIQYETTVNVIVGNLKLKTFYATKFDSNGTQVLKERESTFLSAGKTAKIVPALSYGVFSKIEYSTDAEEIATVSQSGLTCLVKGLKPGTAIITAKALIGETELIKTMTVEVKKPTIPVSNPQSALEYTQEDEWKGDRVYFGHYEQDNNYGNGAEPILWRVLEVTKKSILLLSEYGLESKNINDYFAPATWETCTMRKWLNEDFLNTAFTNKEISVIRNCKLTTPGNEEWQTVGGNDTMDQVFLLSIEEATNPKYGFQTDFLKPSASRTVKNTEYAANNDGYVNVKNGNTCWWLRSSGTQNQFSYFFTNGCGTYSYFVGRRNDAVRPAIRLELANISFATDKKRTMYPHIIVD